MEQVPHPSSQHLSLPERLIAMGEALIARGKTLADRSASLPDRCPWCGSGVFSYPEGESHRASIRCRSLRCSFRRVAP